MDSPLPMPMEASDPPKRIEAEQDDARSGRDPTDTEEPGRRMSKELGERLLGDLEDGERESRHPHVRIAQPSWVYRIYGLSTLAVLSLFILSPLSPDIVRAPFHVSMCPNMTAAIEHGIEPGHAPRSGYLVTAAQDSGRGVFKLFGSFAAGWACDKFGRKPTIVVGTIGDAIPLFAIAMTCDTAFYIPLYTVMGFFDSFVSVGIATFVADVVPASDRAVVYGRLFVPALLLLLVLSPVLGQYAEAAMQTHVGSVFNLAAIFSLLPILFAIFFTPESQGCKIPGDGPVSPIAVRKLSSAGLEAASGAAGVREERVLTPKLIFVLLISFLGQMASGGEQAMLLVFLANNFPECTIACRSFLMSAFSITAIVSMLLCLPVSLRLLHRIGTLRLALLGRLAVMILLVLATDIFWIFVALAVALPAYFFTNVIQDLAAALAPKDKAGQVQGMVAATTTATAVLAPPLFAALFEAFNHSHPPGLPWTLGAGFAAVGLLLSCFLTTATPDPAAPAPASLPEREQPLLSPTSGSAPARDAESA